MNTLGRHGIKWSKEETILAFDLYCKIPFGKISSTNKDIMELSKLLGRTSGSVALKMHNLAHFDPELQKRNVKAMAHTSKLDAEVWEEFNKDWNELLYQARCIIAKIKNEKVEATIEGELIDLEFPEGKEREQLIKNRIGQYFFRMTVLNSYENKCCITGLAIPELLVASHIKPWKFSDSKTERTNPMNGLSLNALHDKAFDRGFITISAEYKVIVSSKIKSTKEGNQMEDWILSYSNKEILLPSKFIPKQEFLKFHNDVIFQL